MSGANTNENVEMSTPLDRVSDASGRLFGYRAFRASMAEQPGAICRRGRGRIRREMRPSSERRIATAQDGLEKSAIDADTPGMRSAAVARGPESLRGGGGTDFATKGVPDGAVLIEAPRKRGSVYNALSPCVLRGARGCKLHASRRC